MPRVLPAIVALFSLAGPALSADLHRGPIHPGWGIASQATVVPQANVTIVDELGSPPLPYRGFKYPLDDAGYFFPPHPAAPVTAGSVYSYGGRRVVAAPAPGGIGLPFAHVEWCHARYASYRASDNSFLPPRGQRRVCVSPYQ